MADLKEIKMHDSDLTISFDGLTISLDKYVGIEKETASAAKKRIEDRKKEQAPSAILFVHGFDSLKSEDEIKVALNSIAPVKKVMIRKNFCFVRFSCVADATKVMVFFHGKEVLGFVLSIEYGMPMQSSSSSNTASSTAPVAIDRAPHWNPLGSKDDRNERDSRYKEDKGNDRNGGNRKGNSSHIENSQRDNRQTSGDRIRNINDTERRGIRKDGESSGSYSRDTKNLSTRDIREIRSNNNSLAFGSRKDTLYSGESTRRNGTNSGHSRDRSDRSRSRDRSKKYSTNRSNRSRTRSLSPNTDSNNRNRNSRYTDDTNKRKENNKTRYDNDNWRDSNANNENRIEKNRNERKRDVVTNVSTTKIKNPFCDPNLFPKNVANGAQSKSDSKKSVIIIDKYGNQKWSKGSDTNDTKIIDTDPPMKGSPIKREIEENNNLNLDNSVKEMDMEEDDDDYRGRRMRDRNRRSSS